MGRVLSNIEQDANKNYGVSKYGTRGKPPLNVSATWPWGVRYRSEMKDSFECVRAASSPPGNGSQDDKWLLPGCDRVRQG